MRVLALIPARGGSKRLPGKNIRPLGGLPLLLWSVAAARDVPEVCDILVSTDSEEILAVARAGGAMASWLRPAGLATDTASSVSVCLHALDWYESERGAVDALLLLQPTSPFRSRETIRRGIELFRSERRPVVAVSPARSHPAWCFRIEDGGLRSYAEAGGLELRSQDLPPAFVVNGALYLIDPADLRRYGSFHGQGTALPLHIAEDAESWDIDTEFDWSVAEALAAARRSPA